MKIVFAAITIGLMQLVSAQSHAETNSLLQRILVSTHLNAGAYRDDKTSASRLTAKSSFVCGSQPGYRATCSDGNNCCGDYTQSPAMSYCCPSGHSCDGRGGCE